RAEEGDADGAAARLNDLLDRHMGVVAAITSGETRARIERAVREEFAAAIGLVRALAVLREVSPRSLDAGLAIGELASSRIVPAAFVERRLPAVWIDGRAVIVTDAEHTGALPDMTATQTRARGGLGPA